MESAGEESGDEVVRGGEEATPRRGSREDEREGEEFGRMPREKGGTGRVEGSTGGGRREQGDWRSGG